MERKYDHNAAIVYVDPRGVSHAALVTAWWGVAEAQTVGGGTETFGSPPPHAYTSEAGEPGCNLLFVSSEADKTDPYGRQIERATSVVHRSKQPAHGGFWRWPDE